jgi:acyl-CoA reductase-like NAD-dependent aldehyde dehydrogenase
MVRGLALGGHRLEGKEYRHGFFIEPTIFTDVAPEMRIAQEEIFGPVVSVIPCRDLEHAIEIGNGVKYGLSSCNLHEDVNRAFHAMERMHTGIFYVNSSTIGAEVHLPFGGTKATGMAIAKVRWHLRWRSSPSGSRSTLTTAVACRRLRSTLPNESNCFLTMMETGLYDYRSTQGN